MIFLAVFLTTKSMLGLGPSALSFKAPMCLAPTLISPLSPLGLGGVVAYHPRDLSSFVGDAIDGACVPSLREHLVDIVI